MITLRTIGVGIEIRTETTASSANIVLGCLPNFFLVPCSLFSGAMPLVVFWRFKLWVLFWTRSVSVWTMQSDAFLAVILELVIDTTEPKFWEWYVEWDCVTKPLHLYFVLHVTYDSRTSSFYGANVLSFILCHGGRSDLSFWCCYLKLSSHVLQCVAVSEIHCLVSTTSLHTGSTVRSQYTAPLIHLL